MGLEDSGVRKNYRLPTSAADTVRINLARTGCGCLAWQLHLPVETDMKDTGIVKSVQIWAPPQSPNIIINYNLKIRKRLAFWSLLKRKDLFTLGPLILIVWFSSDDLYKKGRVGEDFNFV